ncbi:hypothetical protein PTT_11699 [Pyrenophora teres f. teres 0-1]|uniref:Uncharacterized protein n=2 Tax=Pyrenophora teres f. teres TaxID=97479 RepID=E3RS47_PYRTT|nr:hypothetical protein PTT_11699 [Pyrenophora teres f. teres 0-1]KAE8824911.1 hypothetical protein PTNB85_09675 [Pyrenophora teres f. teres]KAE8858513.1 hypothetical protein PTNB29_07728 [Pyrenophora teres f. teres]
MAAPDDDENPHSQAAYTQPAFGTQAPRPIPSRSKGNGPDLAGNTQGGEVNQQKHTLISLLGYTNSLKPRAAASDDFMPNTVSKQPTVSASATSPQATAASPQLPPPPREESEIEPIHLESPTPAHRKKRRKEASPAMAKTQQAAQLECSWMQGIIFNRDTLKVPKLQQECLSKETSWLKPQPGIPPFQNGNMPQSILQAINRIADERATIEDGVNTDDESDVDPSPDSLPLPTQNDEAASIVSWSPSPEPPQMSVKPPQELPPDSSIEKQTSSAEHKSASQEKPSTQQSEQLDSDDEMEDFIPQPLGEDLVEARKSESAVDNRPSSLSEKTWSVVQVRETPVAKSKFFMGAVSHACAKEGSEAISQEPHTSSTSIIQSTYDISKANTTTQVERDHVPIVEDPVPIPQNEISDAKQPETETYGSRTVDAQDMRLSGEHLTRTLPVREEYSKNAAPVIAETSAGNTAPNIPANLPSNPKQLPSENINSEMSPSIPRPASGATKRKLVDSPGKSGRKHPKRREIKIVGFSDDVPVTGDLVAALRKDREESLRRFQEERRSSTSVDSQTESAARLAKREDFDDMDLGVGSVNTVDERAAPRTMSPRHQSLYDEPSPMRKPATHPTSRSVSTTAKNKLPPPTEQPSVKSDENDHMTIFQSFKEAYPEYAGDMSHFKKQCEQMYKLNQEDKMVPKWQWDDFIIRNRTDYRQYAIDCIDQGDSPEPYHRFYKDNIRDTLYKKGIIGTTKVLQRALDEMNGQPTEPQPAQGRLPERRPYQPPITHSQQPAERPNPLSTPIKKPESSRKSLPTTFHQPKLPPQNRINNAHTRPRHSLPTQPQQPRSRPPARQSTSTTNSVPQPNNEETTGDPFRDYFFAVQRSTSWTGNTEVSPKPSSSRTTSKPCSRD